MAQKETHVLLIGAAGGVGQDTARRMVDEGWTVTATVLDDTQAQGLATAVPGIARIVPMDLGDCEQVLVDTQRIVAQLPRLDHVACCAGLSDYFPLEMMSLAATRRLMEVNAFANLAVYQAVIGKLRENSGRILFISSMGGRVSMPLIGSYCASKFALEAFADAMRRECRSTGVHVILIEPGAINSPMLKQQVDVLPRDLAQLSDADRKLYGSLMTAYSRLSSSSRDGGAVPPDTVAAKIVEALADPSPLTRYTVGADAAALVGMLGRLTDAEADDALQAAYDAAMLD